MSEAYHLLLPRPTADGIAIVRGPRVDPACEECDCADGPAPVWLVAECDCDCHA